MYWFVVVVFLFCWKGVLNHKEGCFDCNFVTWCFQKVIIRHIKGILFVVCLDRVAFYSYLSNTDMHPKPNQTIVFDHVVTNTGGKFNSKTGVFTCPIQGVYAFSWTVYCSNGGYLISELVVNSRSVGDMLCSGQGDDNIRHTSSVAVVELNEGDSVYVRTHPIAVLNGVLWSGPTYFSSFSGWTVI